MNQKELAEIAIQATLEAGIAISRIYRETEIGIEYKKDSSPITIADKKANQIINERLAPTNIPIISEENSNSAYSLRQTWEYCWMVDPLDGTKEFIKKNDQFTVNIALIHLGNPLLGVVYAPAYGLIYFSEPNSAFMCNSLVQMHDSKKLLKKISIHKKQLPLNYQRKNFTILASKSQQNPETAAYIEKLKSKHQNSEIFSIGSSLKFCMIAEGKADIYPRFSNIMEWDTAAGHAIVNAAGGKVINPETGLPLIYNKENLSNPWFIASNK
jgi:3'(2'), 5'-bisphosphate nucleotidase